MSSSALNELLDRVNSLSDEDRGRLSAMANSSRARRIWVPNEGPQRRAFKCEADELFYGGEAGGGKTDLAIGLSLTGHLNSLLLRRYNKDAKGMADRMMDGILGSRRGWNGQDQIWRGMRDNHRQTIEFGGCPEEADKQRYKGRPHDLIAFDEIGDFLESQYRFIIGWNRSTVEGQRKRVLATGNPPTTPEGLWVIQYWGPWLDPTHPNPAREGELRWFTTVEERDQEVDGPGPHLIEGRWIKARSRTFIRAKLGDNPDLSVDGEYEAVLMGMPKELRDAYALGKFDASMRDNPWQLIPTAWVKAAQARWTPSPPANIPMCAIAVDVAQGGADNNVISTRHDGWYAPLIVIPGSQTPLGGSDVSGLIIAKRRDAAEIIIDCGGGYGGQVYSHLKDNGLGQYLHAYKGAEKSVRKTNDKQLKFTNKRSEVHWRFREALDPDQPSGSTIALPPDPTLVSDLTAPTYVNGPQGIEVEKKEDLVDRLGRSPDRGDAVVMCWTQGSKMASDYQLWQDRKKGIRPKVIMSHAAARRRA